PLEIPRVFVPPSAIEARAPQLADLSRGHHAVHRVDAGHVAEVLDDGHDPPGLLASLHDRSRDLERMSERFLHEDVPPGRQRRETLLLTQALEGHNDARPRIHASRRVLRAVEPGRLEVRELTGDRLARLRRRIHEPGDLEGALETEGLDP